LVNRELPAKVPFVWYNKNCYYAVVKEVTGAFFDAGKSLALY